MQLVCGRATLTTHNKTTENDPQIYLILKLKVLRLMLFSLSNPKCYLAGIQISFFYLISNNDIKLLCFFIKRLANWVSPIFFISLVLKMYSFYAAVS
jgi:hypothetical protein